MLSMAAFGVDSSLAPELARMIGPLPPHEASYSVERIVMTGVVPMYGTLPRMIECLYMHCFAHNMQLIERPYCFRFIDRLPLTMLALADAFEFQHVPDILASLRASREKMTLTPTVAPQPSSRVVMKPVASTVPVEKTPSLAPAIDPVML